MTEGISESFCFYIFGIACLTPWNFFITPQSYWNTKFADNTSNGIDENEMQKFWDSSLSGNSYIKIHVRYKTWSDIFPNFSISVAICGVQFLFCIVGTVMVNFFSRQFRFIFCFCFLLLIFCFCSFFALVDTSNFTQEFFAASLCIAVLMTILRRDWKF